ncbi:DUF2254 domain-containing protein [Bradyrhizobium neotropicale]|uniref:DUF2254 domain-containing protein n=1 Tax=Bradyrhizobium neotropicale TaxID=1497615 RepID=UPI0011AB7DBF|nr:DUF2254 domain-containing protein [Bradyrhizobium neotropicale]
MRWYLSTIWKRDLFFQTSKITIRGLRVARRAAALRLKRGVKVARKYLALADRRLIMIHYGVRYRLARWGSAAIVAALIASILASFFFSQALQPALESYFNSERFPLLRNLLATTGGALIGATAIGFSVVMIAVQLNFARMPHGFFRKLSADFRLLGAFAATFVLAIGVSGLSLIPDASWSAIAVAGAIWSTLLILVLFLYGYRRALDLINPIVQLRFIAIGAQNDLRSWARRSERLAPLLNLRARGDEPGEDRPKYDLSRVAFFKANPLWTSEARRAVAHATSFARRYAEQGDYEVSSRALEVVVLINACYVDAKGRTFLASNPIFDASYASDGFINETLEHLRRLAHVSTTRGDEDAIRQVFTTIATLVQTYMTIDYSERFTTTKEHSLLAAGYLTGAVEGALPRNLPDVVMEGIRLTGASARRFLAVGRPNDITSLVDKISAFSIAGVVESDYRPLTLTGMEQLAQLTFDLVRTQAHDIRFAAKHLRESVEFVAQTFLSIPDTPLTSVHSTFLAPYYSLTKTQTLADRLTGLSNAVITAKKDDEIAKDVIRNIQLWSAELYRTEKTLLLLSIEKKSHFTFDVLHWIAHITKLLIAIARTPACNDNTRADLDKNASWLISVVSWIPEEIEATRFVENFSITELLFEVALDAAERESGVVLKSTRDLLMQWAFKAGRHETGWGTLGKAMLALVTLVLCKEDLQLVTWLKVEVASKLNQAAVKAEIRDTAARELRGEAASLRPREFEMDSVRIALNKIDRSKARNLLTEIADILSPGTSAEPVSPEFF